MTDTLSIKNVNGRDLLVWKDWENNAGKAFDVDTHPPLVGLVGETVVPGPDWKWGLQGGRFPVGIVLEPNAENEGWLRVRWRNGDENSYRWGAEGAYDLKVKPAGGLRRCFSWFRGRLA